MIKAKWESWYKLFSHENGLKCSKKVGIFPEIGISPKDVSSLFMRGF